MKALKLPIRLPDENVLWWDDKVSGKRIIIPISGQQEVLDDYISQYIFVIAGSGGGKSSFLPYLLYNRIKWKYQQINGSFATPDTYLRQVEVMVTEPTLGQLNNIAIKYIMNFFKGLDLQGEYAAKKNQYTISRKINLKDGRLVEQIIAEIYFISADHPDSLEGIHPDIIIADEVATYRRSSWIVLKQRVVPNNGQFIGLSTPKNLGWVFREPYREWLKDKTLRPHGYHFIFFKTIDNPHSEIAAIEKARKEMSKQEFALRYLGEFVRAEGLVYNLPDTAILEATSILPGPEDKVYICVDYGWGDPTAILFFYVRSKYIPEAREFIDTFYFFKEYYAGSALMEDHIEELKWDLVKYNVSLAFYDPSGRQNKEQMQKAIFDKCRIGQGVVKVKNPETGNLDMIGGTGLKVRFFCTYKNNKTGINEVTRLIKTNNLYISGMMKNTIDEFENYKFEKNGDDIAQGFDHTMDAMRYGIVGYEYYVVDERKGLVNVKKPLTKEEIRRRIVKADMEKMFPKKHHNWRGR